MSDNISSSFKSLSHPIRVQILLILADHGINGSQFTDISRELQIESSSKLSFHLEKLAELINQDDTGRYYLNEKGKTAISAIHMLGVEGTDQNETSTPITSTNLKVESTDQDQYNLVNERPSPSFAMIFAIGLLFQLFIAIGIPLIFAIIFSRIIEDITAIAIIFTIMSAILTLANGGLIYFLTQKNQQDGTFNDLQVIILAISSIYFPIVRRLNMGGPIFLILPYILLSIGIYVTAELTNSDHWENSFLEPTILTNSKPISIGLVLISAFCIPLYRNSIYTERLYSISNGERFVYQSSHFSITNSTLGYQGLNGFTIAFFLISCAYLIPKLRKDMTLFVVAGLLIVVKVLTYFRFTSRFSEYSNAINIDTYDGWSWVVIDILGIIFYIMGIILAVQAHRIYQSQD